MVQIENSQAFFHLRHPGHDLMKALVPEFFVFNLFKFFPQLLVNLGWHQRPEGRDKHRILPGRVRLIHAEKGAEIFAQFPAVLLIQQDACPGLGLQIPGNLPSRLMLLAEHLHQGHHAAGAFERRKNLLFLDLFMIVLDKVMNDASRGAQGLHGKV